MRSSQQQNGLSEERMQMIVVDDLTALDNTGIGPGLRRSPPARLGSADRNKVAALAAGKGVTLCCCNADFPVQGLIDTLLCRNLAHIPVLSPEEEGQ